MAQKIDTGTDNLHGFIDGLIGRIIFNKPEKHNAVSIDMWLALTNIIENFEQNKNIRVIILSGAGDKAFISGADISEFNKVRTGLKAVAEYDKIAELATQRLYSAKIPTIAMINGYCIGGGLGIAIACDIRLASLNSSFAIPAAKLGLGYGTKGVQRIVNLIGPAFARELLITAEQFNADDALAMGLINRTIKKESLINYTEKYANGITQNAPMTIFAARESIKAIQENKIKNYKDYLEGLVEKCFSSEDYAEGRSAFKQKRKPSFKGK